MNERWKLAALNQNAEAGNLEFAGLYQSRPGIGMDLDDEKRRGTVGPLYLHWQWSPQCDLQHDEIFPLPDY